MENQKTEADKPFRKKDSFVSIRPVSVNYMHEKLWFYPNEPSREVENIGTLRLTRKNFEDEHINCKLESYIQDD